MFKAIPWLRLECFRASWTWWTGDNFRWFASLMSAQQQNLVSLGTFVVKRLSNHRKSVKEVLPIKNRLPVTIPERMNPREQIGRRGSSAQLSSAHSSFAREIKGPVVNVSGKEKWETFISILCYLRENIYNGWQSERMNERARKIQAVSKKVKFWTGYIRL